MLLSIGMSRVLLLCFKNLFYEVSFYRPITQRSDLRRAAAHGQGRHLAQGDLHL